MAPQNRLKEIREERKVEFMRLLLDYDKKQQGTEIKDEKALKKLVLQFRACGMEGTDANILKSIQKLREFVTRRGITLDNVSGLEPGDGVRNNKRRHFEMLSGRH